MKQIALLAFDPIKPPFSQDQHKTLEWIAHVHAEAEALHSNLSHNDKSFFLEKIRNDLEKIGLGKDKIKQRQLFFDDFFKQNHLDCLIYNLSLSPCGKGLDERMKLYDIITTHVFEQIYHNKQPPCHLIHTTCTGYSSPSPAQKLVSNKSWGHHTVVSHAYHMGCYAAIPSIRSAESILQTQAKSCDIVHTEFCSLHMNPLKHSVAQLVIESLFADGAIYYQARPFDEVKQDCLKILSIHEELIADSLHGMSWQPSHFGFSMSLSKDVPVLISKHIQPFVKILFEKAGRIYDPNSLFAIHPGGPKIIDHVAKFLNLELWQYKYSVAILHNHGNMSSATLPHVWDLIIKDDSLQDGQLIVSLAFGPGLTMAGAIFELKRG